MFSIFLVKENVYQKNNFPTNRLKVVKYVKSLWYYTEALLRTVYLIKDLSVL